MSASSFDAIVIGAGHNGLAAAAVLAKTGLRTLVLESRDRTGGLCAGEEFHPGYRHTGLHHDTDLVRPWLVERLDLRKFGLQQRSVPPLLVPAPADGAQSAGMLIPTEPGPDGSQPRIDGASGLGAEEAGFKRWLSFISSVRAPIGALMDAPAPALGADEPIWPLLKGVVPVRRLGGPLMLELMRAAVLSAEDWLSEFVGDARLRAALSLGPLVGSFMGPLSPQSAGLLLLRASLAGEEIVGGPARLAAALEQAAKQSGAEIRCGYPVERIAVEGGASKGVFVRGELIAARIVVSALDPRRTLLDLVDPFALPPRLEDEVRTVRVRATSAKLHLALSRAPRFPGRDGLFERFRVAASPVHIERAFDGAKRGELPKSPPLDVRIPTASDPSLAPAGHHVLSAHVFGVPYGPVARGRSAQEVREQLLDAVLSVLGEIDPDISSAVVAAELLVPEEIEARYGAHGGHLMHGEHALDQLWVGRPGRTTSGHATPIRGLFLGSGGTHPMGGAVGAPGALAALRATEHI